MTIQFTRPAKFPKVQSWSEAGTEPKLADMLADPIVHLVMARDHLSRADVEKAVAYGQRLLRSRLCSLCAA